MVLKIDNAYLLDLIDKVFSTLHCHVLKRESEGRHPSLICLHNLQYRRVQHTLQILIWKQKIFIESVDRVVCYHFISL